MNDIIVVMIKYPFRDTKFLVLYFVSENMRDYLGSSWDWMKILLRIFSFFLFYLMVNYILIYIYIYIWTISHCFIRKKRRRRRCTNPWATLFLWHDMTQETHGLFPTCRISRYRISSYGPMAISFWIKLYFSPF